MKLTTLSLLRPVTVAMVFVSLSVLGLVGANRLPLEFLPDIEFPGVLVIIPYRNSTPEEVERRITRPVEEVLATIPGIERMNSESREDGAWVFVFFGWGSDTTVKGVETRDKIDSIRHRLPQDIEPVQVRKFSASDDPVLITRISTDRDLSHAWEMLNRNLKRRVERLDGVSRVELHGVAPREVRIELSAARVAAHGVDLRRLAADLRQANFAITAGDLVEAGRRYYVRPEGRFDSLEAIRTLMIRPDGLRLGDIAEVVFAEPVRGFGRRLNMRYAVAMNVYKETGANLVEVTERVNAEIEVIGRLPEMRGITLFVMHDAGADVKRSLKELLKAGLFGALLALVVLYAFLRDARMTGIVVLSVPLSIFITLGAMYFLGFSLNILTLMGLMLSVGMLVDNSVVVTESVYKHRAEGASDPQQAALRGVNSVGLAVTLGTLTTMIVFAPNIFGQQDEISVFLTHVAVTICVALGASLLVAITLIPQLTTRVHVSGNGGSRMIHALSDRYARVLAWSLGHRGKMGLLILAVLGSVMVPMKFTQTDMFPQNTSKQLFLRYNVNGQYQLDKVEEAVDTIERFLTENLERWEIESLYSYFDYGRAETTLLLRPPEQRRLSPLQIRDEIAAELPKIAIGAPSFDRPRSGEQLAVQVFGESSDRLRDMAYDVAQLLRGVPGLTDVRVDTGPRESEVRIRVDRERARARGLSSQEVAEAVATAMRGTPLRPFRTSTGEVETLLEFRRADRADLNALMNLPLINGAGERVPLFTVADVTTGEVPGTIRREDRRTAMSIQFGTAEGTTPQQARQRINQVIEQTQLPLGYSWGFGRAFDREEEQQMIMMINMLLAMALIYIVMAALFESLLGPLAIITGIFFSFVGVWWFFLATGTTFSIMASIGMLVLMGIVVNNGIVLIDHVNQLRAQGLPRDQAMLQGARDRLRPILMTVGTTVLGLVPLAIGDTTIGGNGPPYYPMARAIIGGLLFSTVVSLLMLPTIYIALDDLSNWGRRTLARARGVYPVKPVQEVAVK
jgi:hydrophobic/amphiphilic exporter-1 (mainly G- bacteria), HAE1 family